MAPPATDLEPASSGPSAAAVRLGRLGVWSNVDHLAGSEVLDYARRVEALGFDTLWIHEGAGREPFVLLGALAMATERVCLGVGIASVYARDAMAAHAGALALDELTGGRFVLGLGVSHVFRVEGQRGHSYQPPLAAMRAYLDAYAQTPYQAPRPAEEPPVVVAALRSGMLRLAAERADGAFPYFVPLEYLARARATIDTAAAAAGKPTRTALVVTLPILLERDADAARVAARRYTEPYLKLPNYRNNLLESGFDEADLVGPGSDRLVYEIVAHGSVDEVRARIDAFHAAGADHVALIPLSGEGRQAHIPTLEALAG